MEREDYSVFEIDRDNCAEEIDATSFVHTKDGISFRVRDAVCAVSTDEQAMRVSTQTSDKIINARVFRFHGEGWVVMTNDNSWIITRNDK
jgi:hypothetical protein